jgi:hypothetical protein
MRLEDQMELADRRRASGDHAAEEEREERGRGRDGPAAAADFLLGEEEEEEPNVRILTTERVAWTARRTAAAEAAERLDRAADGERTRAEIY